MYQFTIFSLFSDSSWVGKTIELPSNVFLFEGPLDTSVSHFWSVISHKNCGISRHEFGVFFGKIQMGENLVFGNMSVKFFNNVNTAKP